MSVKLKVTPEEQGYLFGVDLKQSVCCPHCHSPHLERDESDQLICADCGSPVKLDLDIIQFVANELIISMIQMAFAAKNKGDPEVWAILQQARESIENLGPESAGFDLLYLIHWLYFDLYASQDSKKAIYHGKEAISALKKWAEESKEEFDSCFWLARACGRVGEYIESDGSKKEQAGLRKLYKRAVKWMKKAEEKAEGIEKDAARACLQAHLFDLIQFSGPDHPETDSLLVQLCDLLEDNRVVSDYLHLPADQKAVHQTLFTDLRWNFPELIEIFVDSEKPKRFKQTVESLIRYQKDLLEMFESAEQYLLFFLTCQKAATYYDELKEYKRAIEIDQQALDVYQSLDLEQFKASERFELMNQAVSLTQQMAEFYQDADAYKDSDKAICLALKLLEDCQDQFDSDYLENVKIRLMVRQIMNELFLRHESRAKDLLPKVFDQLAQFKLLYPDSSFLSELEELVKIAETRAAT